MWKGREKEHKRGLYMCKRSPENCIHYSVFWEVHIILIYVQKGVDEMLVIEPVKNAIIYGSLIFSLHCCSM